jgi:hypothetical protein
VVYRKEAVLPTFIKGLELSEQFYAEAVRPLLVRHFPDLVYSAARIGAGSDVLGFDTPQSTDHDWGPRLMLFLGEADHKTYGDEIDGMLRRELPPEIHGYSTHFERSEEGTTWMVPAGGGPINHGVSLLTVRAFFQSVLNFDPIGDMRAVDWLGVPEQNLLSLTAGRVYHDGLGQLAPLRRKLRYYPHDVWLYLLAAGWRRIAQEEAFMGRCGQVGDELGSRLVAARLVRDLMRLCFTMERRYAPYLKWLGSAFAQLDCAADLGPILTRALAADSWPERQTHLSAAYERVAAMHNALGITEPLSPEVSPYYDRPFVVIHGDRFVDAIRAQIESDEVRALPEHLGGVDQFIDSTDAQHDLARIKAVYG